MNPVIFGIEHLIYIIISVILAITAFLLAKKYAKTERIQKIIAKCAGALLLAVIFFNRLALVFEGSTPNWLKLLTDSFCSTSSYVMAFALLFGKRNNKVLHFVWFISLVGGILTTFAPDFIGQNPSFLYPPTILGLMHHTLSAIIVMLLLLFKYIDITYKKWYCTIFGFFTYFTYGAFLMCVLNFGNPFYMVRPAISGTPLTAWVIAPIYLAVYALILLILELIRKKKLKNSNHLEN